MNLKAAREEIMDEFNFEYITDILYAHRNNYIDSRNESMSYEDFKRELKKREVKKREVKKREEAPLHSFINKS